MGVFDRRRGDVTNPDRSSDTTVTTEGPPVEPEASPAEPEHAEAPAATSTDTAPLVERIAALNAVVEKTYAEALQTGDFVRQIQRTLGDGVDAIRNDAMSEANEALMRAHSAVALGRIGAQVNGEPALTEALRAIEAVIDAELAFVGIRPLVPAIGDPIDTRAMRTIGGIPDGVDHATAQKTVESISACGYQLPDRRIPPTVTVRWHTTVDTGPQS